ncbi:hypothetical protein [Gemmobacter sp. LW-1]|uniref:hypothetical protein n=1 Tax=Gemmobacter sp. LW-1 TaxID=1529005 RepID=UPI0006C75D7E|nr:hypothetical protein [Gemmobacter sp. LW-1]
MAFDLTALPVHPKAGKPAVSHIYRDASGLPVLVANRYEPAGHRKFFLPYDVARGEWKAPAIRPLYQLDRLAAAPADPVLFVEGEKCADVLAGLGFLATTSFGGAKALAKTDLAPLAGRRVVIWPDHDAPGRAYATEAKAALLALGCSVAVLDIVAHLHKFTHKHAEISAFPRGWDAADAVAEGMTALELAGIIANVLDAENAVILRNSAEIAVKSEEIGMNMELWHSPDREAFASVAVQGHVEHWPIAARAFRELISYRHRQETGKMLSATALEDHCRALSGEALFDGACHRTFLRMGEAGRSLYLNLGDVAWRGVAIDAQGWQVIERPPVRFQCARSMAALPEPVRQSQGIAALRPFLNTGSEEDFRMMVAWLLGCFHPRGPYPILILTGEQGSAKSTTAKVLRSLIDPANPMARSAPQSEQDLVIAAKHNHVMAFDNLSGVKPVLADALCRIATGGGFGTRKLHSDSDEVLFTATRPILLNGIPDLASRPDLADRAIVVHLPVIAATARQFEAEFWKAFERASPGILAALLDATSCALARIGSVTLPERPRMADFAKWITAAEPALGWPEGAFLQAYASNRQHTQAAALDGNPLAEAILALLAAQGPWQGIATDLLRALRQTAPALTADPDSFPRYPNKLTNALRRVQPLLRGRGVTLTQDRESGTGQRVIRLECA